MTEKEIVKIYNGEIELVFYPNSHQYKINGERVQSVTTVLGVVDKSRALMIWQSKLVKEELLNRLGQKIDEETANFVSNIANQKRDDAANVGTLIHAWVEKYINYKIKGGEMPDLELPHDELSEKIYQGAMAFVSFLEENKIELVSSEQFIYSRKYNYVGICDILAKKDGKYSIIDIKTGNNFYKEMEVQVSAYQQAIQEEFGYEFGDNYIVKLDKNEGTFEVKEVKKEDFNNNIEIFSYLQKIKSFFK